MAKIEVALPFSDIQTLSFAVDEDNLGEVIGPASVNVPADETALIMTALDQPVGTPPLEEMVQPGQRVLILSDDNTRPTPVWKILPYVLERLQQAGIHRSDIEILIAAGTHRPMTDEELEAKVGAEVKRTIRVTRHDCHDSSTLVKAGTSTTGIEVWLNRKVMEADFIIAIGNVVPHPHAGWSGGAKILYPGVAGAETIAAFHRVGIEDPVNHLGRDDAPARRSLEALANTVGLDLIINTVLTSDHRLYRIFCGHPEQAQAVAQQAAREVYGVPVKRRYNVIVSNSYPAYLEFWQAGKGLFSADLALNPGGAIILTTPCPEGIGVTHPDQAEYLALDSRELLHRIDTRQVKDPIAAAVCVKVALLRERNHVVVVSPGLREKEVRTMGFGYYNSVEEALEVMLVTYGQDNQVAVLTHGGETVPCV